MHQELLKQYARVIVEVGINLQPGDNVIVRSDTESLELLREVVRICWAMGAHDVITRISDKAISLAYYEEARDEVFDDFPDFEADYSEALYKNKYHGISLRTPSLDYFSEVDPERMHRRNQAANKKLEPLSVYMDKGDIKWVVAASASDVWAKKVFPDLEPAEALEKLWQLIFQACRIDQEDPVQAWKDHDKKLKTMENWMDSQDFEYLHYEGPGTDLKVYLAEKNKWVGGSSTTPDGITYMANIPTEEVFGTPDRNRVDGTLRATKPLSVGGKMLEGMEFEFKDGQVVSFKADTNQDVLENQMQMDEGANRLGEVALVAHSSPISKMNVVFGSTLFDENASCHFALGSSYAEAIRGGEEMSQAERMELGANKSMIHIDFMVGSDKLQVTGYKKDGSAVPVLVNGEFPEF
jgi:aminopeptidase